MRPERSALSRILTITTIVCFGICAVVVLYAALHPASIVGDDSVNHLNWIEEFIRTRASGVGYPRWIDNTFGGLGAPAFYFYPPLPYFIASVIHGALPSLSPTSLFHCLLLIGTFGSAVSLTAFLRWMQVRWLTTVLAAGVYAFFPYRFTDAYVRNALGEHLAFVWIPLVWLGIMRLVSKRPSPLLTVGFLAIMVACLLMTNVPSFLVTSAVLGAYLVVKRRELHLTVLLHIASATLLATLISAVYWLPAAHFSSLLNRSQLDLFKPSDNPWQFYLQSLYLTIVSGTPHELLKNLVPGLVLLVSYVAIIVTYWRRSMKSSVDRGWVIAASVCLFFQLPWLSPLLWDHFPGMAYIQMSWRWNVVGLFVIASYLAIHDRQARWTVSHILSTAVAVIAVAFYLPFAVATYHESSVRSSLKTYRIGAPEYLPANGKLTYKSAIAYAQHNEAAPPAALDHPDRGTIAETQRAPNHRRYALTLAATDSLTLQQFNWPTWELLLDSSRVETISDSLGRIKLAATPGVHSLDVRLTESRAEVIGERLSLFGLAGFLLTAVFGALQRLRLSRASEPMQGHKTKAA